MDTQTIYLIGGVIILAVLMFFPQWQARRRRKKRMESLEVGARVMTVGGIIGTLTRWEPETERASLEVAPGIELEVVTQAISQTLASEFEEMPEGEEEEADTEA